MPLFNRSKRFDYSIGGIGATTLGYACDSIDDVVVDSIRNAYKIHRNSKKNGTLPSTVSPKLAMNRVINTIKEYVQFTTSTQPFVDPDSGEWNLSRLLPNVTKTVTDMMLMARGGRMSYVAMNKAGRLTKSGILIIGVPSLEFQKYLYLTNQPVL